jgi:hypothetical protein
LRKEVSTENAAFKLRNGVFNLPTKNVCWRNFCDLAKAFDCMNNEILLAKCISMDFEEYLEIGSGSV